MPGAKPKRRKRCYGCGAWCDAGMTDCHFCGASLKRRRFRMDRRRVALCHALAARKGLDGDAYRARLAAVGVASCKALKRESFAAFVQGLEALPDWQRVRGASR